MNPFFNKYFGCKSKNVGPFLAFGEDWFRKYQPALIFLLNFPIIKIWVRWIFRIHLNVDCKYSEYICGIMPNNYVVWCGWQEDGQVKLKTDFRTHPKFSKRIYFAFRWWWWILHYLDEAFKPAWMPQVSFGFDTLTAYPDPNPETSTVDGYLYRTTNTVWSSLRGATGVTGYGDNAASGSIVRLKSYTTTDYFATLYRSYLLFDTNTGSENSIISTATIYLYLCNTRATNLGNSTIDIVSSNPSANTSLGSADFSYTRFGTTVFSDASISGLTLYTYTGFSLSSDGISNINKTGISKFGVRLGFDTDDLAPTWSSNVETKVGSYFADYSGTSTDPKIVIEYTRWLTKPLKQYISSSWVEKPVKKYISGAWSTKPVKVYI